jgi:hypothetical protein
LKARTSFLLILCGGLALGGQACSRITTSAGAHKPLAREEMSEAELAMKSEALVNLPRYVEWPAGAFVVPKTPMMIGVYGQSKMHKALFDAAHGKVLNGRIVMVRRYHWPHVPNCHVLFIARSERHRLPWIMKKIEHTTVLTVSEFDDFLPHGGILRMSMKDEKLRFHVNTTSAKDVGLKFSSQFLKVADQVVGEP